MGSSSGHQFATAIVYLISLILSITVHEYGHALVADRLGDGVPRQQGRVTLNPMAHVDPIGTILMPLIILFTGAPLIGWGRPVLTNPANYTRKLRMKVGHMLVAAAGPAMNLIFAFIISIVFIVALRTRLLGIDSPTVRITLQLIQLNFTLMFFNLLPLPPLDGGTVLRGLLPDRFDHFLRPLERYGAIILLGLLITGFLATLMYPAALFANEWFRLMSRFIE